MSYSTSSPPSLASCGPLTGKGQIWFYTSADPIATVNTAAYISNGSDLGMKVGDLVYVQDSSTPTAQWVYVAAVTAGGSADLADGTTISVTNSD